MNQETSVEPVLTTALVVFSALTVAEFGSRLVETTWLTTAHVVVLGTLVVVSILAAVMVFVAVVLDDAPAPPVECDGGATDE